MNTTQKETQSRTIKSIRRVRQAGMTLVEIMIVIVIMALIGTGVTVALLPSLERANIRATATDAQKVREAMVMFRAENPGEACPDMEDLAEGQYIDDGRRMTDAWDQDFELTCDGRDVAVVSPGPDGQFGNEDDIQ